MEEKRSNIADTTTLVIPTNIYDDKTKKINGTNDSEKDNQKLSSFDKSTTEVALLVKSSTDDVSSNLVKPKPKAVKRNLPLPNGTTVTNRLSEIVSSGTIYHTQRNWYTVGGT